VQENVRTARSRGAGVLTVSTAWGPDHDTPTQSYNAWSFDAANEPQHYCALMAAAAGTTTPTSAPATCGRIPAPVP
jgi:hypothetical protein